MKHRTILLAGAVALALGMPAASAQDKQIDFKLSYWVAPSHPLTPGYKAWAKEVEEKSNGSIKVTLYPSSQLGSGKDHYDLAKRGIADFVLVNPGYTPGRFPVFSTVALPFLITDSHKAAAAFHRWYRKYAEKEMPDHYVCHVYSHADGTFHSNEPIRVPADVKGLKIRTANHTMSNFVNSIGGSSVQVPIMEAYETLKRGIAQGITSPWDGLTHPAFKFAEVTKYTLDVPLYVSGFTDGISRLTYNRMSDAQKKVIDSVCTSEWSRRVHRAWYDDGIKRVKDIRASDREIIKIGPKELALWRKATEPVVKEWAEAVTKAGYDPEQVMKELKDELKKEGALFEGF